MRYLDFIKKYQNLDLFTALMDELGFTDEEITKRLEISKQSIYDAKKRLEPIMEALKNVADENPVVYGNPDVNLIVSTFKDCFGTTKANNYDRYAAKRLAAKHGVANIVAIIEALARYGGDKYCPSVNSVRQLEDKLVSVMAFLKKQSGNLTIDL